MMRLLFVKNNSIGSRLIRWATHEPVSHVAVKYDDFVLHSTLKGVNVEWYHSFVKKNIIVHTFDFDVPHSHFIILTSEYDKRPYDIPAYLFFAWSLFLKIFFGKELPLQNAWGEKDSLLCTEFAGMYVGIRDELAMTTPYTMYLMLARRGKS